MKRRKVKASMQNYKFVKERDSHLQVLCINLILAGRIDQRVVQIKNQHKAVLTQQPAHVLAGVRV